MAASYLWPANVVQDVQKAFQQSLDSLDGLADNVNTGLQSFLQTMPNPDERRMLVDALVKFQSRYKVSCKTLKLLRPRDGSRLLIQSRTQTSASTAATSSPQPQKYPCEMKCPHCGSRIGFDPSERGDTFKCQCGGEVVLW